MRTNRLHYLYQKHAKKRDHKLSSKSLSLIFISAMLLSACGIKGDLYQTPVVSSKDITSSKAEQEGREKNSATIVSPQEKPTKTLASPPKQSTILQSIKQSNHSASKVTAQVNE